jgi:hypothetical protein
MAALKDGSLPVSLQRDALPDHQTAASAVPAAAGWSDRRGSRSNPPCWGLHPVHRVPLIARPFGSLPGPGQPQPMGARDFGPVAPGRGFVIEFAAFSTQLLTSIDAVAITGSSDFEILGAPCAGALLAPGDVRTLTVRFTPSGPGPRTATLTYTLNAGTSIHTILLSGTGVPARG